MKLLTSQCSFQGGRNCNEDSVLFKQRGKNAVAIVADGLGGYGNGDIASHIVTTTMGELFLANPVIDQKHLTKLFQNTNRAICAEQKNGIKMKSTAVGWFYNGKRFAVAHIGDSRLYHFRQKKIIFQTTNVVERGKKDCVISEKQSIITENERECKIVPNLLLEEDSVEVHQEVWIKEREQ